MKKLTLLLAIVFFFNGCKEKKPIVSKNKNVIEKKVDSLLSIMTLKEKIGQMNQYNGSWDMTGPPNDKASAKKLKDLENGFVGSMLNVKGVKNVRAVQKIAVEKSRLGIPLLIGFDVIHGYKTISPIPLAEAASWDLKAIKKSAEVAAKEAAASGINWTFAPMVDISRDPRWGRVMEGAGEDPFLASKIAYSRVKGFQGEDLANEYTIAACAKHFAAYGFVEAGKEYNTVSVGNSTLYNTIFPPFKAAAKAGVKTFMNAFNLVNGIPATGNAFLQRTILKEKWGFKGFIVSDWASIKELKNHGFAKDNKEAGKIALNAGSDMDMESYAYIDHLEELVKEKKIDETLIDDAVRRILTVKYELGLFDDPYKYCDTTREQEIVNSKKMNDAVLDIAKKSIVLLKNEPVNNQKLLPLKKQGQNITVIGALANDDDSMLGSWRIGADANTAVTVLEGLQKYKGNKITYEKGADVAIGETFFHYDTKINNTDKSKFTAAIKAAKNADVVIMVVGEHGFQTGEGRSRTNLDIPGVQLDLLKEVYKVNKNIVLVLANGRPLTINWSKQNLPAIVEAWQLGTQSGNAIAQVLYGDYNPSGKLPVTFPRNVGQIPIYYNHKSTGRPTPLEENKKMVFWSKYTDVDNTPLYPFGYGLSYTTFSYKNLKLDTSTIKKDQTINVSVDVTNTGDFDGYEVVQLYIQDIVGSIARPVRELKGFEKVHLKKGETKTINFIINSETLQFYTANNTWEVEPGDFNLWVGTNSNATLKATFKVVE